MLSANKKYIWILPGMSVVIAGLIVAWWTFADGFSVRNSISVTEGYPGIAAGSAITSNNQVEELNTLRETLSELNKTAANLKDSIRYLEAKLIRAHVLSDTLVENNETPADVQVKARSKQFADNQIPGLPAPSGSRTRSETPAEKSGVTDATIIANKKASERSTKSVEALEPNALVANKGRQNQQNDSKFTKPQGNGANAAGEWIVNLVSFSIRSQAEQFMSKASAKGFSTSLKNVNVNGKIYWRVRITGLNSQEEAEEYGNTVKKGLGLKDIWITRR